MDSRLNKIDRILFPIFNKKIKNKFFDWFLPKYTYLGGLIFVTALTLTLTILGKGNTRYIGMQMTLALIISQGITYSIKAIIARERPYNYLDDLYTFGFELKDYSFPSGHSSSTFTIATIVFLNMPTIGIFLYLYAGLIAISRIYLGVHYPTDIIGGIIIGVGSSLIVYFYLLSFVEKLIKFIF